LSNGFVNLVASEQLDRVGLVNLYGAIAPQTIEAEHMPGNLTQSTL
jgi:hypothetical protein